MPKSQNPPVYRYTWPGQNEKHICALHAAAVADVADAIGLDLQFIKLSLYDVVNGQCHQNEKVSENREDV